MPTPHGAFGKPLTRGIRSAFSPNLLERDSNVPAPNQVLAGDITYISTTDGWLYLAVLLDLYSRRVVGWAMSDRIDTELALSALHGAASSRSLEPRWIHHTDRDCRYGSDDYLAALKELGARPSMSRKGDCWDSEYTGVCHRTAA